MSRLNEQYYIVFENYDDNPLYLKPTKHSAMRDYEYTKLSGGDVSGKGIKHVIDEVNTDLSDRLGTEIEDALSKANAMEVPFEAEIIASNPDGNARVAALITALRTVEGTLEEVFEAMGFTVPVPE